MGMVFKRLSSNIVQMAFLSLRAGFGVSAAKVGGLSQLWKGRENRSERSF